MGDEIYLIGSFTEPSWRQEFIENLPNIDFNDPRYHQQSSIVRLNWGDMGAAANNASLAYIPEGKRLGTTSYAELGVSRANGQPIIAVDENKEKDSILERVSTYNFNSKQEAYEFLKSNPKLKSNYNKIGENDKTKSEEPYKSILFAGDYPSIKIGSLPKNKQIYFGDEYFSRLDSLSEEIDLIVANFNPGKKHNPQGLFFMGMGYELKVPIIEIEGNNVPYPPLLGLSRRVLTGEGRHNQLEYYLNELASQHIKHEALTYYKLMQKFN